MNRGSLLGVALGLMAAAGLHAGPLPSPNLQWNQVRGNACNTGLVRFSSLGPEVTPTWLSLPYVEESPVLFGGKLYLPRGVSGLSAVDKRTGRLIWVFSRPGERILQAVACEVRDGRTLVYAQFWTGSAEVFYCIRDEGDTASLLWRQEYPDVRPWNRSLTLSRGRLFAQTLLWRTYVSGVDRTVVTGNGLLWVKSSVSGGDPHMDCFCLDAATGEVRGVDRVGIGDSNAFPPGLVDGDAFTEVVTGKNGQKWDVTIFVGAPQGNGTNAARVQGTPVS